MASVQELRRMTHNSLVSFENKNMKLAVMSVRTPAIVRSQCRKVAIIEVIDITSLINSVLIDPQIDSATGLHEPSMYVCMYVCKTFTIRKD